MKLPVLIFALLTLALTAAADLSARPSSGTSHPSRSSSSSSSGFAFSDPSSPYSPQSSSSGYEYADNSSRSDGYSVYSAFAPRRAPHSPTCGVAQPGNRHTLTFKPVKAHSIPNGSRRAKLPAIPQ